MRRFISVLLILLTFSALMLPVSASETAEENTNSVPPASETLLDIIRNTPLDEFHVNFSDPSKYDNPEHFEIVKSTSLLPVYTVFSWADLDASFDEISTLMKSQRPESPIYVSFTDSPFALVLYDTDHKVFLNTDYPEGLPRYLQDVATSSATINFFNESCTVSDLICFDGLKEELIFFRTDKGDFVRVYSYWSAEPYVDYRMEDFQVYAKAYYELISSYDYNYDENGSGKGGGGGDFISFTKEYEPVSAWEILFLCLGAAVVLGTATAITVFLVRNKKQKAAK